jgi:hypothetical protein
MNIISHNKAYCLFPQSTLYKLQGVMVFHARDEYGEITRSPSNEQLKQYRAWGFLLRNTMSIHDATSPHSELATGTQSVGDRLTLTLDCPLSQPSDHIHSDVMSRPDFASINGFIIRLHSYCEMILETEPLKNTMVDTTYDLNHRLLCQEYSVISAYECEVFLARVIRRWNYQHGLGTPYVESCLKALYITTDWQVP